MSYYVAIASHAGITNHAIVNMDEDLSSVKAAKQAGRKVYRQYAEVRPAAASELSEMAVLLYAIGGEDIDEMTVEGFAVKVRGQSEHVPIVSLQIVDFRDITDC